MNKTFDNIIRQRSEMMELYDPAEIRATAEGYEFVDLLLEDAEVEQATQELNADAEPGVVEDFVNHLSTVATTIGDLPNMAIRGILHAGGEAAYSAGIIDKGQADVWRKMLKDSSKIASGEGVPQLAEQLGTGLSQFGAGMFGPFKVLKAMGFSRPIAAIISEGISGAFAFNPDDPNLGNFINSFEGRPEWLGAMADFIETNPDDSEAENRFRNVIQDVVPSAAIEAIVASTRAIRGMDADTLIKAGEKAEANLASRMSGATLSANPVGAIGDVAVAGAGKVAQKLKSTANKTGVNVADDGTLTFNGKQIEEWTPTDFKNAGKEMGIKRLGPGSKPQEFKLTDGTPFNIPGGLKGKFTYYDMLQMKADGIDASKIPEKLHVEIQKKMSRSLSMDKLSDEQVWAGLVFGMTSPNNPLFPNQLAMSRLRGKDAIDELANSITWKFGDDVDPAVREAADKEIAAKFNLNAGDKGGLGVRGTANYTRVAEMAQMFKENPKFFRRKKNEVWQDFAERIFSQIAGLSSKTGTFGVVFQDPLVAGISAIDRHMARLFQDKILSKPKDRIAWQKRAIDLFNERNKGKGIPEAKTMHDLSDGHIGELILSEVGKTSSPKFRLASGEINPKLPEKFRETDWIKEPKQVEMMGAQYKAALQANQVEAMKHGLGIFSSQWMLWDKIRRRLEPHENMFPGLEKMPRPSVEQARKANVVHKESGHKDNTKELVDGEQKLKPTKPIRNPSGMAYFSLPLAFFALQGEEK